MKLDQIPRVRILAPDGTLHEEGYYFQMPEYMGYPIIAEGEKPKPIPTLHCVVTYTPGDWGLPNAIRIIRVTPPHKIKIVQPIRAAKSDEVDATVVRDETYENFRRANAYPEVLAALKKAVHIINEICAEECTDYGFFDAINEVEKVLASQEKEVFVNTERKEKPNGKSNSK